VVRRPGLGNASAQDETPNSVGRYVLQLHCIRSNGFNAVSLQQRFANCQHEHAIRIVSDDGRAYQAVQASIFGDSNERERGLGRDERLRRDCRIRASGRPRWHAGPWLKGEGIAMRQLRAWR
jgi:hypothetical protein